MPPMATSKADADGSMSDAIVEYYDEKSAGGALGLVITEHCHITPGGRNRPGQPSVADDAMLPGLARLARTFHANGCKAVVQISHAGAAAAEPAPDFDLVSASSVGVRGGAVPRALSQSEIAEIVAAFAAASRRVKQAGFDGVELHSAHGYLLNQFLSPLTNQRTDEYGGDLLGRIRMHFEVVAAVREAVGDDFPILMRIGVHDYAEGGTSIEDGVAAAIALAEAGVDVIDVTGGLTGYVRPDHDEPGYFAELSAPIKAAVAVPVILTGGVTQVGEAEELLERGVADLIGVGRALLRDSQWAQSAMRELEG